jgi:hypothetical protein
METHFTRLLEGMKAALTALKEIRKLFSE